MHKTSPKIKIGSFLRVATGFQRLIERRPNGPIILLYHAVVDRDTETVLDAYCVNEDVFHRHLQFFSRQYHIVPLQRIVEAVRNNDKLDPRWLAITLDDAYRNQARRGAAILADLNLPWALTVPAGLIGSDRSVWTNELAFLLFYCHARNSVPHPCRNQNNTDDLTGSPSTLLSELRHILFNDVTSQQRHEYIETLIDAVGRERFLSRLHDDGRFVLADWADLQQLHESGVEIVSHGWWHHPQTTEISSGDLQEEIRTSRDTLAARLGSPPDGFAVPHGIIHPHIVDHLTENGYRYGLTSRTCRITTECSPYLLPRVDSEYPLYIVRNHVTSR